MDLVQLYKAILESLGLQVSDNGNLHMVLGDTKVPCTISGEKQLVLPFNELLKQGLGANQIGFHPLAESVVRGESPVLKKLRVLVNFRLTSVLSSLMDQLMAIAVNSDYHSKLSPTQAEFLSKLPDADEKTYKALDKVLDSISTTGSNKFISVYLKRGGKLKNESFKRVAIAGFPINDDFDSDQHQIFEVKMRVKDKASIKALFEYILPNTHQLEEYSAGSNSHTAPYFDALMQAYVKIAKRLNVIVHKYRKHLANAEELKIDVDWADELADLSKFRDLIPVLEGNAGEPIGDESAETAPVKNEVVKGGFNPVGMAAQALSHNTAPVAAPAPQQAPVQQPAPIQQQAPTAPQPIGATGQKSGGLDWNDIVNRNARMQPPQQPIQQPFNNGWNTAPVAPQVAPGGYAGYNRGVPNQPMNNGWGQPAMNGFSQPVNNGFGTFGQQPVNNGWPQQQQNTWGQPAGSLYSGGI